MYPLLNFNKIFLSIKNKNKNAAYLVVVPIRAFDKPHGSGVEIKVLHREIY